MYGALLTAPSDPQADFGLIFMNTQQYTTMCGHAMIGAATAVIETGMIQAIEPETSVVFDTPVGLIHTQARVEKDRVREVAFNNAPVFVHQLDARLSVPDLGELAVDIVYSGGFFALIEAERVGLELVPANARALADLSTIDAVEFHGLAKPGADGILSARTAATFGERTIDRSPCGTGTCAKMAVLHLRGQLKVGQRFVSKSIIGTRFIGQIMEETRVGGYQAIVPRVAGRAYLTGFHQFVLDPDDPFPHGFSLTNSKQGFSNRKENL